MLSEVFLLLQQSHCLFRARVLNQGSDSPITGTAPVTHQDQDHGRGKRERSLSSPLATVWPQKTVGAKPCPIVQSQFMWFPRRANPFLAHDLGGQRAFGLSGRPTLG